MGRVTQLKARGPLVERILIDPTATFIWQREPLEMRGVGPFLSNPSTHGPAPRFFLGFIGGIPLIGKSKRICIVNSLSFNAWIMEW